MYFIFPSFLVLVSSICSHTSRSNSSERYSRRSRRRSRSRSSSRDRHRDRDNRRQRSRFGSKVTGHNAIPPPPPPRHAGAVAYPPPQMVPPPPPPARVAPPAMQQVQQRVNDQQLEQLFQIALPPASQPPQNQQLPNPTQPKQQITLPANLSQQQIQALQTILNQGPSQNPTGAPATVGWSGHQASDPRAQTQPWQQQQQQQQQTVQTAGWQATTQAGTQPAAPIDILGLAEKAAQALSAVPGHSTHNFPSPGRNSQHNVTEKDLSQMVQFAIQVRSVLCTASLLPSRFLRSSFYYYS